jgi:hypothetical protein
MVVRPYLVAAAFAGIAATAFFAGRRLEQKEVAARLTPATGHASTASVPPAATRLSYERLHAVDVLALSFPEFYEALRSAPKEGRKRWAMELEQMPPGPRRTAAVTGFYKLMIQFDPALTIKAIREIHDEGVRNIALSGAANAAPGFAMEELALAMAELYHGPGGHSRNYFDELMLQWMDLDPAAVLRFGEEHSDLYVPYHDSPDVVSSWAEVDPKAAKEWLDAHDHWKTVEYRRAFISGWYESDRPAAVAYVLDHAREPEERDSLGNILRGLYYDWKDEARKFVEALPDDAIRRAAFRAAFENILYDEVEDGGEPAFSPRAVADWMVEYPPAYWTGRLTEVFKWSRKPPREMISWIQQQSPAIQDIVAAEYTPPWKATAPDVINAVLQVGDTRLRDELFEGFFKRSYDISLEDIEDAIAKAPLSAEQRAHVLQLKAEAESRSSDDDGEPITDQGSEK